MQEIIIKGTFSNLLKKHIPLLVIFFFLGLLYLGLALEKNPAHANQKYLPPIQYSFIGFGIILFFRILYQYIQEQQKPIVRLTENGIYLLKDHFFDWKDIYHFRILYVNQRITNVRNQKTAYNKRKKLEINDQQFDLTDQNSEFELEDIVEIIKKYKNQLPKEEEPQTIIKF